MKNIVHTTVGIELVRKLAEEGERIFTSKRAKEIAPSVGLSSEYLRQALHHLVKSGWLVRLRNGLFALSAAVPGTTPVHEFEIAMALVNPAAISHWSAMHYHGLTDQAPHRVFVLTTTGTLVPRVRSIKTKKDEKEFKVNEIVFQFTQVKPEYYFGTEKVWVGEARVVVTDPEKTLLDGLARPHSCGDFAEVLHAFELRMPKLDLDKIISYALKLDGAAAKRLGWVLENQGVDPARLELLAQLHIKGFRKLDPTGPYKGPYNQRWMIQENLPGKIR